VTAVELSDEQELLQETTRRFIESRSDLTHVRALIDDAVGFDRDVWRSGADMGWLGLLAPEAHGGSGFEADGLVHAAIVAEELGRMVQPGPFLSTSVVAFALGSFSTDGQRAAHLPGLVAGRAVAAWCPGAFVIGETGPSPGVTAGPVSSGFLVTGNASVVQDAHVADALLVSAKTADGVAQFLVDAEQPGVEVVQLEGLDLARRFSDVRLHEVAVPVDALLPAADFPQAIERQLQVAVVLQCAESVGVAARALEFSVEYARDRIAFGRPIGSYQAIKHRLADAMMRLEASAAATTLATDAVQHELDDAARAVSVAATYVGESCSTIVQDCLQVHGGIGFTWDHDVHLYLRRAKSNEATLGSPAWHRERLCSLLGVGAGGSR
jgi:alkylation response protein AidB-like acyl-CoA dehydrogenase